MRQLLVLLQCAKKLLHVIIRLDFGLTEKGAYNAQSAAKRVQTGNAIAVCLHLTSLTMNAFATAN